MFFKTAWKSRACQEELGPGAYCDPAFFEECLSLKGRLEVSHFKPLIDMDTMLLTGTAKPAVAISANGHHL